jgi:Alpha-2-macroglobulin MG1 domain.
MKNTLLLFLVFLVASSFSPDKQILNTSLTMTVRDELGNIVPGVSVQLFETEEDYLKEKNVVFTGTTDAKGIVKFKKMKAISYFVLARKEDKDNTGGGEKIGKLMTVNSTRLQSLFNRCEPVRSHFSAF